MSSIFFTFLIPLLPQHLATLGEDALAEDGTANLTLETAGNCPLEGHRLFRRARNAHAGIRPTLIVATQGRRVLLELNDGELEKVILKHAILYDRLRLKSREKRNYFLGLASHPMDELASATEVTQVITCVTRIIGQR